ncbi:hydrolase, carbon-nitrogen family [Aspergillus sclerotialis]|uniref:Hydrolase, carbon-nitrogen family n=1 Tax=Aspergillus sclerotialis TaxID=2070753 RepID=A0A3A2ZTB1_9EURO|nr:hydrolase, carbon-nitrogen family [Aspergillus sclerotialis]
MPQTHRIAVIQWHIKVLLPFLTQILSFELIKKDLALEENHQKACDYIRDAAAKGAELAVLPEYHLNGYCPADPSYSPQTHLTVTKPYLEAYKSLAKELSLCIVPGTIVENHPVGGKDVYYNVAYFIDSTGNIIGEYRKKNLWLPERDFLSAGREKNRVFDTPIGKVGMLICWDIAYPEAFRELVSQGVQIVVAPTFWTKFDSTPEARAYNSDSESLLLQSTITARCFENGLVIAFANAAGKEEKWLGMSQVSMPVVGSVGKMGDEEGLLVVDVDMRLLDIAEDCYGIRTDLKREGWHYAK